MRVVFMLESGSKEQWLAIFFEKKTFDLNQFKAILGNQSNEDLNDRMKPLKT